MKYVKFHWYRDEDEGRCLEVRLSNFEPEPYYYDLVISGPDKESILQKIERGSSVGDIVFTEYLMEYIESLDDQSLEEETYEASMRVGGVIKNTLDRLYNVLDVFGESIPEREQILQAMKMLEASQSYRKYKEEEYY